MTPASSDRTNTFDTIKTSEPVTCERISGGRKDRISRKTEEESARICGVELRLRMMSKLASRCRKVVVMVGVGSRTICFNRRELVGKAYTHSRVLNSFGQVQDTDAAIWLSRRCCCFGSCRVPKGDVSCVGLTELQSGQRKRANHFEKSKVTVPCRAMQCCTTAFVAEGSTRRWCPTSSSVAAASMNPA